MTSFYSIRGFHKPIKRLFISPRVFIYAAKLIVPRAASLNKNISVVDYYSDFWKELIESEKSEVQRVLKGLFVIKVSLGILFNHYLFGDFNGVCLRERVATLFKING